MSLFFYNLFLILYQLGIRIASLFNNKARLWVSGRKDIFTRIIFNLSTTSKQTIWMHCASLGEFEQGRPLLERLKNEYPTCKIVLSFFSPSGYEIRKEYAGADEVIYLPMDGHENAGKFIDAVQPSLVLWVKYEYWYYYLTELKRRNIPVLLVSGIFRESQPFFKWYGGLWKKMLECFRHLFVQTEDSKNLLAQLKPGAGATVSGDTRFDRVTDIAKNFTHLPQAIIDFCGSHKVIVAGSTWEEDEAEWTHYVRTHPEIKFIIAPHEVDEENIKDVQKKFAGSVLYSEMEGKTETTEKKQQTINDGRRTTDDERKTADERQLTFSSQQITKPEPHILIIDNIGMLSRLYCYAHITYVGGGFGEAGIHNVLEAAVYGKPVIFGPEYEKFAEAKGLVNCKAAFSIENALQLETLLNKLFEDENMLAKSSRAAKEYVYNNRGATQMIVQYIYENRLITN